MAAEPKEQDVQAAAERMFGSISEYLQAELKASGNEYDTLLAMNQTVADQYLDMAETGSNMVKFVEALQAKYEELQPCLDQIDEIDVSVTALEQAVGMMDAYTKRLEAKFKKLDRAQMLLTETPR